MIELCTSNFLFVTRSMGNCFSANKAKRDIIIGTFGLDNAGKTTVLHVLKGDSVNEVAPTVGFRTVSFESKRFRITLYDLGGGARIRDIWKNYFSEIYGLIFVVDASDRDRTEEVRQTFSTLAQNGKIQEKPMLFLLNKQDKEGALDEVDAKDILNVGAAVNKYRSPCRVETCIGTKGTGKHCDKGIRDGFQWLLDQIYERYDKLSSRIEKDVREVKILQEQEKIERAERVRRIREEREKEEMEAEEEGSSQENQENADVIQYQSINGVLDHPLQTKNKTLPFDPMPQITEEIISQRSSDASPPVGSRKKSSSSHVTDFLVAKAETNPSELISSTQMSTGLGASNSSVPRLPPISPRLVRPLPPPPPDSSQPSHAYENRAYESETAPLPTRNLSNSDDMTQLSDITHKRKRKRKRLQRFQKVGASDESDDTSQRNGGIQIDLASLPSSEPRPPTPPDQELNDSATALEIRHDSTKL